MTVTRNDWKSVSAIVAICVALLGVGVQAGLLIAHTQRTDIHETEIQKQDRLQRNIAPLRDEIEHVQTLAEDNKKSLEKLNTNLTRVLVRLGVNPTSSRDEE